TTFSFSDPLAGDRERMERAGVFVDACRRTDVTAVVGSRPDIAVIAGADGVELADDDLPPLECAGLTGPGKLIGGRFAPGTIPGGELVDGLDYAVLDTRTSGSFIDSVSPMIAGRTSGEPRMPFLLALVSQEADPKRILEDGISGFAVVFDDGAAALITRLRKALDEAEC
ncbi:MAG: thiamine phosphate synthase, partial [Candidatus Latescibacteria bacterium]|nr:thiamine phosphate synthase [Candidatus Latescibacterota bacterium]